MPKDVYELSCPCCGKRIEVDTRTGKARAVNFEESRRGKSFDDLVSDAKTDKQRRAGAFDAAQQDIQHQTERLEERLEEAKKAAKRDLDKPPHPFQD